MITGQDIKLLSDYQQAVRSVIKERDSKQARIGLIIYIVINAILIVVNLVYEPDYLWFFYPLGFWGLGIAFYYGSVTRNLKILR